MPFNENIAERFLESEKLVVGWPWRLFLVSLFILLLALAVNLGLKYGFGPYLNLRKKDLDKTIQASGSEISETQQENFINFYSQLVNLRYLLDNHLSSSAVFSFLERKTVREVYYEGAVLAASEKQLRLEGVAKSYENLAQQIIAFEQSPETEKAALESSQAAERGVRFNVLLNFEPSLLRIAE